MVIPSIGPELAAMREERCSAGIGCSPETTPGAKEREAEMEVVE